MAKDTQAINGIPQKPAGMNDNSPLDAEANWYKTLGAHSASELYLQRCNGKLLIHKYPDPILAIHGDLRTRIFIETSTQLLMLNTLEPEPPTPVDDMEDYILLREEQPNGTSGGASPNFTWGTRKINTEVSDTGGFATLVGDDIQFTLAAGTYRFQISAPGFKAATHKARLFNVTDSVIVAHGTSEACASGSNNTTRSFVVGKFVIAAPKTFQIEHFFDTPNSQGLGLPAADTDNLNEVYTVAEFWRAPGV